MRRLKQGVSAIARLLPKGPGDAVRQLGLFVLADLLYESVRGIVFGKTSIAYANGYGVASLERKLGLFFEPSLQALAMGSELVIQTANWAYLNTHFIITATFLVWLYFARNGSFYFVRNMFMVAMSLALIGYLLVPTAPPRLLPGLDITDTIAQISQVNHDSAFVRSFVNPFAAVPSMHVAFALMVAGPAVMLVRRWYLRLAWAMYPVMVFMVVVVTGNHFWFDAAVGACVAALSTGTAQVLSRARPEAWSWRTRARTAEA